MHALNRADELDERSVKHQISLDELISKVTTDRRIDFKDLLSYKRTRKISDTRAIISYLAAVELRNSGAKIASKLGLSEKSVSRCLPRSSGRWYWGIERGQKLLPCREMPFSLIFHWYDKDERLIDYVQ